MQPRKRTQAQRARDAQGAVVASFTIGASCTPATAQPTLPAVVEGRIQSRGTDGPFVEWSGARAPAIARVLWMERTPDWSRCVGLRVALAFEGGDPSRPLVLGLLEAPPPEAFRPAASAA